MEWLFQESLRWCSGRSLAWHMRLSKIQHRFEWIWRWFIFSFAGKIVQSTNRLDHSNIATWRTTSCLMTDIPSSSIAQSHSQKLFCVSRAHLCSFILTYLSMPTPIVDSPEDLVPPTTIHKNPDQSCTCNWFNIKTNSNLAPTASLSTGVLSTFRYGDRWSCTVQSTRDTLWFPWSQRCWMLETSFHLPR